MGREGQLEPEAVEGRREPDREPPASPRRRDGAARPLYVRQRVHSHTGPWTADALFGEVAALGLAGEAAVATMGRHVASGRFALAHYVGMWAGEIAAAAAGGRPEPEPEPREPEPELQLLEPLEPPEPVEPGPAHGGVVTHRPGTPLEVVGWPAADLAAAAVRESGWEVRPSDVQRERLAGASFGPLSPRGLAELGHGGRQRPWSADGTRLESGRWREARRGPTAGAPRRLKSPEAAARLIASSRRLSEERHRSDRMREERHRSLPRSPSPRPMMSRPRPHSPAQRVQSGNYARLLLSPSGRPADAMMRPDAEPDAALLQQQHLHQQYWGSPPVTGLSPRLGAAAAAVAAMEQQQQQLQQQQQQERERQQHQDFVDKLYAAPAAPQDFADTFYDPRPADFADTLYAVPADSAQHRRLRSPRAAPRPEGSWGCHRHLSPPPAVAPTRSGPPWSGEVAGSPAADRQRLQVRATPGWPGSWADFSLF
jgi:hypothetical protein